MGFNLSLESYGWKKCSGRYIPEQSFEAVCPQEISSLLFCGCKLSCSSVACSSRKSGAKCTELCRCLEEECENQDAEFDSYSSADTESDADMYAEDFEGF